MQPCTRFLFSLFRSTFRVASQTTRRGFSLISCIIGMAIFAGVIVAFLSSDSKNQEQTRATMSSAMADAYASELLELFRAHTAARLNTYLSGLSGGPFQLCENLNLIDRAGSSATTPVYQRRVAMADLPTGVFAAAGFKQAANRYFKVEIIDIKTLVPNATRCGTLPPYVLAANERFLVTVGVSWIPPGRTEKAVILSSVLPN